MLANDALAYMISFFFSLVGLWTGAAFNPFRLAENAAVWP